MKRTLIIAAILGGCYLLTEDIFNAITSLIVSVIDFIFNGHKEIDWTLKGSTSLWMFPIGALMGTILGAMNNIEWIKSRVNYFWMSVIGVGLIYAIEYTSGTVLTSLGIVVWRYTDILAINGQITLFYLPVWFALCPLAFWLEDLIIYWYYKVDLNKYYMVPNPMPLLWYCKMALNPKAAAI